MKGRPASTSLKLLNSRLPTTRSRLMNNINYVGMDVHKSITVIVVLNELGQFESRSQIKTKGENIFDALVKLIGKPVGSVAKNILATSHGGDELMVTTTPCIVS